MKIVIPTGIRRKKEKEKKKNLKTGKMHPNKCNATVVGMALFKTANPQQ